jgi:hypothetical protein
MEFALSPSESASLERLGIDASLLAFVAALAERPAAWTTPVAVSLPSGSSEPLTTLSSVVPSAADPKNHHHHHHHHHHQHSSNDDGSADTSTPASPPDVPDVPTKPTPLSPAQLEHAIVMLKQVPALRTLRYKLCPREMDEEHFWAKYFVLINRAVEQEPRAHAPAVLAAAAALAPGSRGAAEDAARAADGGGEGGGGEGSEPRSGLVPTDAELWEMLELPTADDDDEGDEEAGDVDGLGDSRPTRQSTMEAWEEAAFDEEALAVVSWPDDFFAFLADSVDDVSVTDALVESLMSNHHLRCLMRKGLPEDTPVQGVRGLYRFLGATSRWLAAHPEHEWGRVAAQVFGPRVPTSCRIVPAFGGLYVPTDHPGCEVGPASSALVALAMEQPDLSFAPALPDVALELSVGGCDAGEIFAILSRMSTLSLGYSTQSDVGSTGAALGPSPRGARARVRQVLGRRGGGGGGEDGGGGGGSAGAPWGPAFYPACRRDVVDVGVVLAGLVHRCLPSLAGHLRRLQVGVLDFATPWLRRCFFGALPYEAARWVFGQYMSEGFPAVVATVLGVLYLSQQQLLGVEKGEDMLQLLRGELVAAAGVDVEALGVATRKFRVTRSVLRRLWAQREQSPDVEAVVGRSRRGTRSRLDAGDARASPSPRSGRRRSTTAEAFYLFYRPRIHDESSIASQQDFESIWSWLHAEVRQADPVLLFSTAIHGCTLTSLYTATEGHEPTILLVRAANGATFGAYVTDEWRTPEGSTRDQSFYGTGDSFVFRLAPGEPQVYRWKAEAGGNLFQCSTRQFLAVGGNAIRLDDELYRGRSASCDTYSNPPLAASPTDEDANSFVAVSVEVWGLKDAELFAM